MPVLAHLLVRLQAHHGRCRVNAPVCGQQHVISAYLKPCCTQAAGHDGDHVAGGGPGPVCTWAATPLGRLPGCIVNGGAA